MKTDFFRSLIYVLLVMLIIIGMTPGMASAANDTNTGTDTGDSSSGNSDTGDSDTGDSDSGDSDSGDDSGDFDSGDSDSGDDSGDSDSGDDSGDSDSGDDSGDSDSGDDSGDSDSGDDSGDSDSGDDSGDSDSGDDSGDSDSGDDSGDSDSGDDSGDSDSGDDSGDSDTGDDSGDSDSGDDSGDSDTGDSDTGNSNSGDSSSGNSNSGDSSSGNSSSGDSNSGDSSSGDSDAGKSDEDDSSGSSSIGSDLSAEPASNIAVKELATRHVISGYPIRFDFVENVTCVTYIGFDPKKTFRKTTTIVEVLKNNSTLVPTLPPGRVYKYVNIWVGEKGAGLPTSLKNGVIEFKVEKAWIKDNNVSESLITLQWYDEDWKPLYTEKVGEDENYIYFKAAASGFSFFTITEYAAEGKIQETLRNLKDEGKLTLSGNAEKGNSRIKNPMGMAKTLMAISLPLFMILVGYFVFKKKI